MSLATRQATVGVEQRQDTAQHHDDDDQRHGYFKEGETGLSAKVSAAVSNPRLLILRTWSG